MGGYMKIRLPVGINEFVLRVRYDTELAGEERGIDKMDEHFRKEALYACRGAEEPVIRPPGAPVKDYREHFGKFTMVNGIYRMADHFVTIGRMRYRREEYAGLEFLADTEKQVVAVAERFQRKLVRENAGLIFKVYFEQGQVETFKPKKGQAAQAAVPGSKKKATAKKRARRRVVLVG